LKKILEQIRYIASSEQRKEIEYFLMEIHKSLGAHKYLLVLDDVWTHELWGHIEEVLIDANNGSRVLITSRYENVARVADASLEPYKLPFLSDDEGLRLLLKKAICNRSYSNDLINVAMKLVKKCGGLPLALIVLGGLLSRKPIEYTEWNKLLQTMSWHTDGMQCIKILATSYDDLPLALKYCFMYCAAFPEDYEIQSKDLIRMWIAEDFIPKEENKTLEETAERFLEDLVQRYDSLLSSFIIFLLEDKHVYKISIFFYIERKILITIVIFL
jgi:NB-ARC domain